MARETSTSRLPSFMAAMPAHIDSSVTRESSTTSGAWPEPTNAVNAASPCQPSTIAPASMEMMSPSFRTVLSSGMPWTTTSFTEVQIVAGNPPYPRKFGLASCSARTLRATSSRSRVVAPGTAASRVAAWMAATTSPASRILAICSGVLICTMVAAAFLDRDDGLSQRRTTPTIRGAGPAPPGALDLSPRGSWPDPVAHVGRGTLNGYRGRCDVLLHAPAVSCTAERIPHET